MVMKTNTSYQKAALDEDDVENEIKEAGNFALRLHVFKRTVHLIWSTKQKLST